MTFTLPAWLVVRPDGPRRWLFRRCKVSVGPTKAKVTF
jgi:hypothetical protein